MVAKLYINEPYRRECSAIVTDVRDQRVFLSETVFYPEGGGQVGDTGLIGSARIADTQKVGGRPFAHPDFPDLIMIGGEVAHLLEEDSEPLTVGAEVPVVIDWERRLSNMRHHSAAHLGFWLATTARPDLYTKGARIDDKTARFDFRTADRLTTEEVAGWEEQANDLIAKSLEIRTTPVDGEHEARIWSCGDMTIPCGGTHVRSTGDIGGVKMRRKRQGNNLERLYITVVENR